MGADQKPTIKINFMSLSKLVILILFLIAANTVYANQFSCPIVMLDAGIRHVLNDVSLYDGPPDEMADLVPAFTRNMDYWNTDGVDPYLVCQYKDTAKTITIHAKHVRMCAAGKKPFQAYCK